MSRAVVGHKNVLAIAAIGWIVVISLAAVTADLWVPRWLGDPTTIRSERVAEERLQSPSWAHPLGTDDLGRDIMSRVVYGSRISLTVAVLAVAVALVIGVLLGGMSGYYGGLADALVMRSADVFLAFPYMLFAILLLSVLQAEHGRLWPVTLTIGLLGWPSVARVFRASVLSVKERGYVVAARALGASDVHLLVRHILPNAVAPVAVFATMTVGRAILVEAGLSFLGLGVAPPAPSWGRMIEDGRVYLASEPGLVAWPGLAIVATVLAFTVLGDGLRDALDVNVKD